MAGKKEIKRDEVRVELTNRTLDDLERRKGDSPTRLCTDEVFFIVPVFTVLLVDTQALFLGGLIDL